MTEEGQIGLFYVLIIGEVVIFKEETKNAFYNLLKAVSVNEFQRINEKDTDGCTVLHRAAQVSEPEIVELLIKKGADINSADVGGYVPMHLAVMGRQLQNVKELINSGANVNVVECNGKCAPLHFACIVGEVEIVKELIKAGAKIDQADKSGKTPADYARNNKEIMEVLESVKIANRQKEFLEKITVVPERTADMILAKEGLLEVDKELEERR